MKKSILIIEDEPTMRLGMSHFLSSSGYSVKTCEDGTSGLKEMEEKRFDLVITDLRLPGYDGFTILKRIKTERPEAGVIIMTAYADVKTAVQAIKDGAFDYIAKPFSNDELLITIERFLKFRNLEIEVSRLKETVTGKSVFEGLIGVSQAMKDVFDRIESVAKTDVPVLIQGESGTGKELVANAIHNLSDRNGKPCVKINCAAIPENLFESELFGHEKGAFTGATETRKGKFEAANEGCIFFDEIGDMPTGLQAKLLRVLEDHSITRLGGCEPVKVNVRGMYATSKNVKELVKKGMLREDLFYRINVVPIFMPPLRDRKEDIPYLIDHFLKIFSEKFSRSELRLSPAAYETLMSYQYPGNVRELKHALERAALLSKNEIIDLKNLPEEFHTVKMADAVQPNEGASLHDSIAMLERRRIVKALAETGGRKIEAAKKLGISRKVLWKKIRDYNINMLPSDDTD